MAALVAEKTGFDFDGPEQVHPFVASLLCT
jgi:hypothetical protein